MTTAATFAALQGGGGAVQESGRAGRAPDLGEMLMHHLVDGHEIEVGFLGWEWIFHLPEWEPIHIGGLALDFSPTKHVVFMLVAAILLVVIFLPIGRLMRGKYTDGAPSGFTNAMEAMVLFFRDEVVRRNIGHGADVYTSFILTLFFFILGMNLLGLIPFGATATGNLAVTGALAFTTFVVTEISGMRTLGFKGYMGTIFYAPPGLDGVAKALMLVVMTPVELLGKLTKPFALMIRLFANMTAGHMLVLSLLGMIFMFAHLTFGKFAIAGASVSMVLAIMLLELFVAFLQAFIFAMLSAVFIGLVRHAH
jgi:F-type H+-transporting ATPase subunit a